MPEKPKVRQFLDLGSVVEVEGVAYVVTGLQRTRSRDGATLTLSALDLETSTRLQEQADRALRILEGAAGVAMAGGKPRRDA